MELHLINQVIRNPGVQLEYAEYIDWIQGPFQTGEKVKKPNSDHAVLQFEVAFD